MPPCPVPGHLFAGKLPLGPPFPLLLAFLFQTFFLSFSIVFSSHFAGFLGARMLRYAYKNNVFFHVFHVSKKTHFRWLLASQNDARIRKKSEFSPPEIISYYVFSLCSFVPDRRFLIVKVTFSTVQLFTVFLKNHDFACFFRVVFFRQVRTYFFTFRWVPDISEIDPDQAKPCIWLQRGVQIWKTMIFLQKKHFWKNMKKHLI